MTRLIRNHQWISTPSPNGECFYGLTKFAKDYFIKFDTISNDKYFKTRYGIMFKNRIGNWLEQVKRRNNFTDFTHMFSELGEPHITHNIKGTTTVSERMEYDRFCIRQDEPFTQINTAEFDVELCAPIDMRVLELNFEVSNWTNFYSSEWIFKVQVLNNANLSLLMTEEQYEKSNKIIEYERMLL